MQLIDRREQLNHFCETHGVAVLYVFGSRADDVYRWLCEESFVLAPGPSDVDVSVYLTDGMRWTIQQKVAFAQSLEELLGVTQVDLGVLNDAEPFFAADVVRGNRLYARSERQADEYDLYILRRAGDLAPFKREHMAHVLQKAYSP